MKLDILQYSRFITLSMTPDNEIYKSLGDLQGTVRSMLTTQTQTNAQINQLESRLSLSIDKLVQGMNSRISVLESDSTNTKVTIAGIKKNTKTWSAVIASVSSIISVILSQYLMKGTR